MDVPPVRRGVNLADSRVSGDPRDLAVHATGPSDVVWSTTNCWTLTAAEQVRSGRKEGGSDGSGRHCAWTEVGFKSALFALRATTGSG